MKNKFLFAVTISVVLFACKGFTKEKEVVVSVNQCTQYACPTHVDKTSTSLEACPVCNTIMIPLDSLRKDSLKRLSK